MEKDFTPIHNFIAGVLFSRYEFFQNSIRLLYGFFFEFTSKILKTIPAASPSLSFIKFLVSRPFEILIKKIMTAFANRKNLFVTLLICKSQPKKSLYPNLWRSKYQSYDCCCQSSKNVIPCFFSQEICILYRFSQSTSYNT